MIFSISYTFTVDNVFRPHPEQIDDILNKLYIYRSQIKGDFEQKVEAMNKVTENLIEEHD